MARNKKNKKTNIGQGKGRQVVIRLDARSKFLWNKAVEHFNMSEWVRMQIEFHFGNNLTIDQRIQWIKEQILILQTERDKKTVELSNMINKNNKEYEDKILKLVADLQYLNKKKEQLLEV